LVPIAGGNSEHWFGMTEFGPLARTAQDLALMFDVLRGVPNPGHSRPQLNAPLRIAVSVKPPMAGARVDAEVRRAVKNVSGLLADAGHKVRDANPPYPLDIGLRFCRYWLTGIAQDAEGLAAEDLEARTRAMVRTGRWIRRRGWHGAAADNEFGARMRRWFSNHDVLLMPTLAEPAVPIGKWREKGWIATTLGVGNWVFTTPWNIARFPAASVPAGLSADGLPIGMQLVAPPGGESTLLALMAQVEELKPWPTWVG
jgi:amidase